MKITLSCLECGKDFDVIEYRAKTGRAKYCSLKCKYKNMDYKTRKGVVKKCLNCEKEFYIYPSREKAGSAKFCSVKCRVVANKGLFLQDKNWNWKGEDISYQALHTWIRKYGIPSDTCSICKKKKILQWSNKDHKYKRNLEDWWTLCLKCHCKYDIEFNNKIQ